MFRVRLNARRGSRCSARRRPVCSSALSGLAGWGVPTQGCASLHPGLRSCAASRLNGYLGDNLGAGDGGTLGGSNRSLTVAAQGLSAGARSVDSIGASPHFDFSHILDVQFRKHLKPVAVVETHRVLDLVTPVPSGRNRENKTVPARHWREELIRSIIFIWVSPA